MKAIFYLLLLANGVYFIWDYTNPYLPERQAAGGQDLPTLKLATKLPQNTGPGKIPPEAHETRSLEPQMSPADPSVTLPEAAPVREREGHHVDYPPRHSEPEPTAGDTTDQPVIPRAPSIAAAAVHDAAEASRGDVQHLLSPALLAEYSNEPDNYSGSVEALQPGQCFRLGGFEVREQAVQAGKLLHTLTLNPAVLELETEVPMGYWVLYPHPGDYAAAEAKVEQLKALGITEIWLFRDGPRQGEISLGLFKSHERAVSQSEILATKGIPSEIQRWTGMQPRYWLRFQSVGTRQEIDAMLHNSLPDAPEWQITSDNGCAVATASNSH